MTQLRTWVPTMWLDTSRDASVTSPDCPLHNQVEANFFLSPISGGQQQRLCIARALAVDPEVLLLDGPCSALDPIATAKIEDLLIDIKQDRTVVIVTHNMQQAARVADYTGFVQMGKLIEFGKTDMIFKNPSKKETEDYVTGRFPRRQIRRDHRQSTPLG